MAVKIRLTRIGRHKESIYRIVVADGRYARDGRFIEQIGYFDPTKGDGILNIQEDRAVEWLKKGAQPSDTVRNLLTKKGLIAKAKEKKD